VTNTLQKSISKIRLLEAGGAALTLAVVLTLGVVTGPSAQAKTFRVLHSFYGPPDGERPANGLFRGPAGNLYSTTEEGGTYCGDNYGCGTVFELLRLA